MGNDGDGWGKAEEEGVVWKVVWEVGSSGKLGVWGCGGTHENEKASNILRSMGLGDNSEETSWIVSPNPFQSKLYIFSKNTPNTDTTRLRLIMSNGSVIIDKIFSWWCSYFTKLQ